MASAYEKWLQKRKADPPTAGWKPANRGPATRLDSELTTKGWRMVLRAFKLTGKSSGKKRTVLLYAVQHSDGTFMNSAKGVPYVSDDAAQVGRYAKTQLRKRDKGKIKAHRAELLAILKAHKGVGQSLSARELAKMVHRDPTDVGRDLAAMAKAGTIKGGVHRTHDTTYTRGGEFGGVVAMHRRRAHYWVEATEPPTEQLDEFRRLIGSTPSLAEKAATDPMLAALAKAFSVRTVKPADVKFLRYRKAGKGVELEDAASRLGDILTSIEPKEADPKALIAFLKKHGAKPIREEVEVVPFDEPLEDRCARHYGDGRVCQSEQVSPSPLKLEGLEEGANVANTILKQMGGSRRLQAMLGAKHFMDHGDALSFKFPNRKRSKGNYVKITLKGDDTYTMEFSQLVKYNAKPVKTYEGLHAGDLKRTFTRQTGLDLHL